MKINHKKYKEKQRIESFWNEREKKWTEGALSVIILWFSNGYISGILNNIF